MFDAHIHLDWYQSNEQKKIMNTLEVNGMIAVSSDLKSCKKVWQLSKQNPSVFPAFGWHPEQPLPTDQEIIQIETMIHENHKQIVAIGEVGLPFYKRKEDPSLDLQAYIDILERFMALAVQYDLPIVLHAVYDDAATVCDLLVKHGVERAHFHWFKGDKATIKRMIEANYMISVTPDCVYEKEIQYLIESYPMELMMAETDGPWPFEGPFQGKMTHPNMIIEVIKQIAKIKQLPMQHVKEQVEQNTKLFYRLMDRF
ncbi:TatD family deoxyribonuclease [Gracilibacillus salitolerans]|uniref:TatD family deoxyribonuclease n=1 Tax=Gracilibacillus salitolerans TaxID=2663022 RepID=A0A5Q2TMV2_9BACI|nr:TatD family hydrolase [Gracilibacillus salitolerans]QGH35481.1 TatD family deoxyribonuclease [Gracilibacillus salitolerans]